MIKDGGYMNLIEYGILYSGVIFIIFKVWVCSDVYIVLSFFLKKIFIELGRYNNIWLCI